MQQSTQLVPDVGESSTCCGTLVPWVCRNWMNTKRHFWCCEPVVAWSSDWWTQERRCWCLGQSVNQTIFLGGLSSGTTARSTGDSQLMSSKWSGKVFLNRCVLRRRRNVVSDFADVTSSGTLFHVSVHPLRQPCQSVSNNSCSSRVCDASDQHGSSKQITYSPDICLPDVKLPG